MRGALSKAFSLCCHYPALHWPCSTEPPCPPAQTIEDLAWLASKASLTVTANMDNRRQVGSQAVLA